MPTVLITGANRGLGLEFVRQYAAAGWQVIAACRQPAAADELNKLAAANQAITVETLDVLDPDSLAALAAKMSNTPIDVLVSNAGIYGPRDGGQSFGSLDARGWLAVLHTNTIAPIMVAEALLPAIVQGQQKKIVVISSTLGSIGDGGEGILAYRSSKAGLNAAMRAASFSLKDKGIHIMSLHPGWVQTDMGGKQAQITPATSITGLRELIAKLDATMSGGFYAYDGREIPW